MGKYREKQGSFLKFSKSVECSISMASSYCVGTDFFSFEIG